MEEGIRASKKTNQEKFHKRGAGPMSDYVLIICRLPRSVPTIDFAFARVYISDRQVYHD